MNGKVHIIRAGCVLLLFVGVGCSTRSTRHGTATRSTPGDDSAPYSVRSEGVVPDAPVDEAVEAPDVDETPLSADTLYVEDADPPPPVTRQPAVVDTVSGYRVQLFASASAEVAERARRAARERLHVDAYVDAEAGLFKVRVGDCRTRECALALLAKCRESVYRDAWIVPCGVKRHPGEGPGPGR